MTDLYVGVRNRIAEMEQMLNRGVDRPPSGVSKALRSALSRIGIHGSERGQNVEFVRLTQEEYDLYTQPGRSVMVALQSEVNFKPLAAIERSELSKIIAETNSRYPRRLDNDTFKIYRAEVVEQFADTLKVIPPDEYQIEG